MLEFLNSAACFVLMLYSLPVAMLVSHKGMWAQRLTMLAVIIGLFLQASSPWLNWVDDVTWPSAWLNISAAVMLGVWWESAWAFLSIHLGPPQHSPKRRSSDFHLSASETHIGS